MKRGKKYVEAAKKIDRAAQYEVADAVKLIKETAVAKFDETVEAHIRLVILIQSLALMDLEKARQ